LPLMEPENEVRILQRVIEQEHDVAVIEAARKKIHELRGDAAKDARNRGRKLAQHAYGEFAGGELWMGAKKRRVQAERL